MTDATHPAIDGHAWPNALTSMFVAAGGIRWHVQKFGSGPPMLLIHGTGASCHSWEGLANELRSEFTLIIVDLPGHGFTASAARSEMTLPAMARRIGQLLGVLGVVPRVIVGHSAGAAVASRLVLDNRIEPPDLIVALNGALLPWRGVARWLFPPMARALAAGSLIAQFLARRAEQPGAVERMLAGTGKLPPERSVSFYRLLLKRQSHVQGALDMMAMWDLESLSRDLPRLHATLLLVACGEDTAVPADVAFAVKDRMPAASVHYLRGLGHLAHEEHPREIADVIRSAWRKASAGRSEDNARAGGRKEP